MTTLRYNASTGSNVASGKGPIPALLDPLAEGIVGGTGTTVDLSSLEGGLPDLTDANAGDVLWLSDTSSGRNLSVITNIDTNNAVVTVEDDLGTVSSGTNWAIGGTRLSFEDDVEDMKPGWIFSLTGTFDISKTLIPGGGSSSGGYATFQAADSGNLPIIRITVDDCIFDSLNGYLQFKDLKVTTTVAAGSRTNTVFLRQDSSSTPNDWNVIIDNVEVYDLYRVWESWFTGGSYTFRDCNFHDIDNYAIFHRFGVGSLEFQDCSIHDCGQYAIHAGNTQETERIVPLNRCKIWNNTGGGIELETDRSPRFVIDQCNIAGNTGSGIRLANAPGVSYAISIMNTAITGNGGYGVRNDTGQSIDNHVLANHNNAFGLNTSGRTNSPDGWPSGENEQTILSDPYVDSANGDFTPNDTDDGGDLLDDEGRNGLPIGSVAKSLSSSGGGGPVVGCRFIQPLGV